MKIAKRILLVLFLFLVLVIGALLAVPFIFKEELVAVVKEQINENINAHADFEEVNLSLFRSFPHLNLSLSEFSLVGKDQFEGVPFLGAGKAGITINIQSLFGENKPLEIRSVELDDLVVNVLVLADGSANYDITIPSDEPADPEEAEAASALEIALRSYAIRNGSIKYDDRSSDMFLSITGLNHSGDGNFTLSEYDLDTETTIDALSFKQGGMSFLKDAKVALDAIFHINSTESLYVLKDNQLSVNELLLNADGEIQLLEEDIRMDLSFNSPGSDFRSLWSLIPNAYTADYQDVAIDGTFSLEGLVKGIYNETTYPAFRLKTRVNNGNVKYPDLPLAISNIQADLDVNSPDADLDKMIVSVEQIALKIGSDPFRATLNVKTPISDPDVKAEADGIIDLAQWAKAFPIEGIQEMAGRIIADVKIQTRLSTIEREAYEDVRMAGDIRVDNLRYQADDLPLIVIDKAVAGFSPQQVKVEEFNARLGKSDIQASGNIDNLLAYISPEKTMRGKFKAHTNYFFVDEWMTETEEESVSSVPTAEGEEEAIFDRFDFQLDATANKIVYEDYELTNAALIGRVSPNVMTASRIQFNLGESDFRGSGEILNAFDYLFADGILRGNLDVKSDYFDLNPFMEEPEGVASTAGSTEEAYGVIPIPGNIDMTINATVGKLHYMDMDMRDIRGNLSVADEAVVIENGSAKLLGGSMGFTGAYDTKEVEKPAYNFKFDLDKLDFQEGFNTFNTFASFAPVGKLVKGNFSTSLIMSGELGEDMMPTLESVNAKGLFETLNGSLNGLKPLAAIGNALDISDLKESIQLERLKTWFTIENGFFEIEPFDVKLAKLPMTIAGKHSLSQEMNYTINTVIPRSMLGSGSLGNTLNAGISTLVKQAGSLGLNVNDAENLNVQIVLTGNMTDPKVGFKLLGMNGETTLADAAKAEAANLVNEQVDAVKGQVTEEVNAIRNQATTQANALVDSARNAASDQLKQAGQSAMNQVLGQKNPADSTAAGGNLKGQAEEAVDKIKEDIKDFNPFRRKKKKDGDGGE